MSTATLLPDGPTLITGRDARASSAELYDVVTGSFSAPVATQREEGYAATLLPDGTVLMSGGWLCCGYSISTADIYRPAALVAAPVLLSVSQDGKGEGAILHADTHLIASATNPVTGGEAVEIYLTGLADGSVIPPQVAIGGRLAEVLFFGKAPGYAGLSQVNVRVPSGIGPGSTVPVRMNYIGRPSNEVTIGVN